MKTPLLRFMLLVEIVVLFGPATVMLLLSPVAILASYHNPYVAFGFLAIAVAGVFGLYVALNLAAAALDPTHNLPKHWRLGVLSGISACLAWMTISRFDWLSVVIGIAAILGVWHLSWISSRRGT